MKVKELRELIEGFPDEARVAVSSDKNCQSFMPIYGMDYFDEERLVQFFEPAEMLGYHLIITSRQVCTEKCDSGNDCTVDCDSGSDSPTDASGSFIANATKLINRKFGKV